MAGKIVASTINDDTGVLATQNGMTGIAKAWVYFNGTGTPAINGSFNVSSITDNGTGDYTVNFTTAMPNANYSVSGIQGFTANATPAGFLTVNRNGSTGDRVAPTTSAVRVNSCGQIGGTVDITDIYVQIFSS
jgi:hypothetical protein